MSMSAALDAYMSAWQMGVHTSLPATVSEYDAGTHRAKVIPSVRLLMDNGMPVELPELLDVPVIFPAAKSFDLEFPLDKGDGVLLLFAESDIASWKTGADPATPDTASRFSLDASVAIPGLVSKPQKGAARIYVDGEGILHWEAKKVVFDAQLVVNKALIVRDDVYVGPAPTGPGVSLKNHVHPTAVGPSSPPGPPAPIPPEEK